MKLFGPLIWITCIALYCDAKKYTVTEGSTFTCRTSVPPNIQWIITTVADKIINICDCDISHICSMYGYTDKFLATCDYALSQSSESIQYEGVLTVRNIKNDMLKLSCLDGKGEEVDSCELDFVGNDITTQSTEPLSDGSHLALIVSFTTVLWIVVCVVLSTVCVIIKRRKIRRAQRANVQNVLARAHAYAAQPNLNTQQDLPVLEPPSYSSLYSSAVSPSCSTSLQNTQQYTSLQDVPLQYTSFQDVPPEYTPFQDAPPQYSSLHEVLQNTSLQNVTPQYAHIHDVPPPYSSVQEVPPQYTSLQDVPPQDPLLQNVILQNTSLEEVPPQYTSLHDVSSQDK
ncbi:uncharacterized protein LOC131934861 [Physella acuta]|uniref:uncharacterized protein LOC131934861 n=1 Tax=Physella acuta TaxID=109671 RepID=UPI0027DE7235|nr:uncharacterized protein LOC131934861 [Physella acuta]XP_059146990.1 uncharacterized protein LOC131934861 [Physella acuta]